MTLMSLKLADLLSGLRIFHTQIESTSDGDLGGVLVAVTVTVVSLIRKGLRMSGFAEESAVFSLESKISLESS